VFGSVFFATWIDRVLNTLEGFNFCVISSAKLPCHHVVLLTAYEVCSVDKVMTSFCGNAQVN